MTSAEKILAGIIDGANNAAQKILDEANAAAEKTLTEAKAEAKSAADAAISAAEEKAAVIRTTGKSGADLIVRDANLSCRRKEIDKILALAVERINALGDEEYFSFLAVLADRSGYTGEMILSSKDRNRNLSVLKAKLKDGITVSDSYADLNGGFILKNGDIEINAGLDALIHEKRGELVDKINGVLFR